MNLSDFINIERAWKIRETRFFLFVTVFLFLTALPLWLVSGEVTDPARTTANDEAPYNALILDAIASMPNGGGFSVGKQAMTNLKGSVGLDSWEDGTFLKITAGGAQPSFCSEATYLVFLKVVARLMEQKQLDLSPAELDGLLVKNQPDGEGIWGRWNANGPGTARLFHELNLGENFGNLSRARAGDFLKVYWNQEIGCKEKGHSVIFLKTIESPQGTLIRYWSSNLDGGYGEKEMPLAKIPRLIFSRLSTPEGLKKIGGLPPKDDYLASMLKTSSTGKQMCEMVGMNISEDILRPMPVADVTTKALPVNSGSVREP